MQDSNQFCKCGCGKITAIATRNYPRYGIKKGEPLQYYRGHNNKEKRREANKRYSREWRKNNPDATRDINKRWRDKKKLTVLIHYGGNPPRCACCKETILEFLTLDHINGGGNQERKEQGHKGGIWAYHIIQQRGYPSGYRVLCWNCNLANSLYGICPHVLLRVKGE